MPQIIIDLENEDSKKGFQNLLLEYYKQGFLFSSYEINGEWEPMAALTDEETFKEELQYFLDYIKNGFKTYIKGAWKEQFLSLLENRAPSQNNSIKNRIYEKVEEKNRNKEDTSDNGREKPITECPLCNKRIYLSELGLVNSDLSSVKSFPFPYIHVHSYNSDRPHALLMYLDKDFKVRGRKPSQFLKIQDS